MQNVALVNYLVTKTIAQNIKITDGTITSKEINKILDTAKGKPEEYFVQMTAIRTMAKAIYSTKNVGHFGLAFEHYTHFTSPIRRYPDMMVHRILTTYLVGKRISKEDALMYQSLSNYTSEMERVAQDAERSSIKYKQAEYMQKRVGEEFEGSISGVTEFGIFVEEVETKSEGLIRVRDLGDDFYVFNKEKFSLIGQKRKKKYRLGDKVKIKVHEVDPERNSITYKLV